MISFLTGVDIPMPLFRLNMIKIYEFSMSKFLTNQQPFKMCWDFVLFAEDIKGCIEFKVMDLIDGIKTIDVWLPKIMKWVATQIVIYVPKIICIFINMAPIMRLLDLKLSSEVDKTENWMALELKSGGFLELLVNMFKPGKVKENIMKVPMADR